jgi:hypothetical protein
MEREEKHHEPKQRRLEPKVEVAKIGLSDLGFRTIQFSRIDRVRVGFEIYFILERFFYIHVKEICVTANKYIDHDQNYTILLNPDFFTFHSFLQLSLVAAATTPWVCCGTFLNTVQTSLD